MFIYITIHQLYNYYKCKILNKNTHVWNYKKTPSNEVRHLTESKNEDVFTNFKLVSFFQRTATVG